jgi:plastocyanin
MIRATICWSLLLCVAVQAGELEAVVKDRKGRPVADAVILAVPLDAKADAKNASHAKLQLDAVDQVDKQFVPFVKPVFIGSTVHFPNSDNIRHQVYSFSPAKKFELPLYSGTDASSVVFDKAGVVVLGCNIHDWMIGYIYVSDTPYFAKTNAGGRAMITDLPFGTYTVRLWHPGLEGSEEATKRIAKVAPGPAVSVEYQQGFKPIIRVPRISGSATPVYP